MALVVGFVASQTREKGCEAFQQFIVIALSSSPLTPDGSSSSDDDEKERDPKKHSRQKKELSSSYSKDSRFWARRARRRLNKAHCKLSSSSGENGMPAPKLDVIHPINVPFADAVNYETYPVHNRSQEYNGKLAARIANVAKRTESITKF